MGLSSWLPRRQRSYPGAGRRAQRSPGKRATFRPLLEALEDRTVPSTLTVTSAADSGTGSLRYEIAAANSGDTINFAPSLAGQTITLTSGALAITKSLDVEGPGAAKLTISGNNASRVFDGGTGEGGGLLTTFGVTATLSNTNLMRNLAVGGAGAAGGNGGAGLGGGLFNDGPSPFGTPSLTLLGCTVLFNEADGGAGEGGSDGQGIGGGVYNLGTFVYDLATVIAHNHASTSNDNIFTTS